MLHYCTLTVMFNCIDFYNLILVSKMHFLFEFEFMHMILHNSR